MLTQVMVYSQTAGRAAVDYVDVSKAKADFHAPTPDSEMKFILRKGKINATRRRKKALWTADKDYPKHIFFTCPWCLKINKVEKHFVGHEQVSLWCSAKKCARHLTIDFKRS